jgi:hypothetical protein
MSPISKEEWREQFIESLRRPLDRTITDPKDVEIHKSKTWENQYNDNGRDVKKEKFSKKSFFKGIFGTTKI